MTTGQKVVLGSWAVVAGAALVSGLTVQLPGGTPIPGGQPGAKVAPGGAELPGSSGNSATGLPPPSPLIYSAVVYSMLYLLAAWPAASGLAGVLAAGTAVGVVVAPNLPAGTASPIARASALLSSMRQPSSAQPGG